MKLGFQLSGTSKRQKIVNTDDNNLHQNIELITSIEDSTITSLQPIIAKQPLVIPLIQPLQTKNSIDSKTISVNNNNNISNNNNSNKLIDKESHNDLDKLATEELLKELNSNHNNNDSSLYSNLIIPSITTINNDQQTENENNISKNKQKPLLMLNVAPELLNIKDEGERFKYDVSSRANDLNVIVY